MNVHILLLGVTTDTEDMTGTVLNDHFAQSHSAADAAIGFANGDTVEKYIGCDYKKFTNENAQEVLDQVK